VRCHWVWATPIPNGIDPAKAGPFMCAGITVFNPLIELDIKPTNRVGVIGIGGLGHLALQFLNKWGCYVTAFSSSTAKAEEIKKLGAHDVLDTHSDDALKKAAGSYNLILSTVAVPGMDYNPYIAALAPKGRLHILGVIPEVKVQLIPMLLKQKSLGSSPSGAPATVAAMLDFAARHNIAPITEEFPMSKANEAFEHLEAGKARYRIVLKNDLQ
jgi:uncharacterized zinc-type alcohol dehydrogenase-like protein